MIAAIILYGVKWLPLVAALWVLLGVAIWKFYEPQLARVGTFSRWAMPLLRGLGMVALCLALLRPVFVRAKAPEEYGPVIVLLDVSRSMGVKEQHKGAPSIASLVELAEALGKIPAGLRGNDVPALQQELERLANLTNQAEAAQADLEYARLVDRDERAAQARLNSAIRDFEATMAALRARVAALARSKGMTLALEELRKLLERAAGGSSRTDWPAVRRQTQNVATQVASYQQMQDSALYRTNPAVTKACDELGAMSRMELAEQAVFGEGGLTAKIGPVSAYSIGQEVRRIDGGKGGSSLAPTDDSSRINDAVAEIVQRSRGRAVQAIVLVSDGRDVGSQADHPPAAVPVIALSPSLGDVKDVAVTSIKVPPAPFVGETIFIRGEIRQVGLRGTAVDVELTAGSDKQTQHLTLREDLTPYEFPLKLAQSGATAVEVRIAEVAGELASENNRLGTSIKVLSQKIKVAAIAGAATWDFQYVRNALSRTSWALVTDVAGLGEAGLGLPKTVPGLDEASIRQQDVIILCDMRVGALNDSEWKAIGEAVKDRGASVILMAGDVGRLAEYDAHPVARDFLPYPAGSSPRWRTWPGDEPTFRVTPSRSSESLEWLRLDDRTGPGSSRWNELPPLFGYLELPALRPQTEARLVEKQSQSPVLTEGRLGSGRVFFVGLNETWRWRLKVGEKDQDRFWLQLVRHAAEEPYAVGKDSWAMDMEKVVAMQGEAIKVRAKAPIDHSEAVFAQVGQAGKIVARVELKPTPRPGRLETRIENLASGEYEVRLVGASGSPIEGLTMPLRIESSARAELANLSPDEANLARLARASAGGEVLALTQIARIPEKLQAARSRQGGVTEQRLWDSGYLLAFVVACLAAEWAMRKREGLA